MCVLEEPGDNKRVNMSYWATDSQADMLTIYINKLFSQFISWL